MQITIGYYNYRFKNYYFIQPPNSFDFLKPFLQRGDESVGTRVVGAPFCNVELHLTDVPTEDAEVFQSRVDAHNREVDQNIAKAKARAEECIE